MLFTQSQQTRIDEYRPNAGSFNSDDAEVQHEVDAEWKQKLR